MSSTSSILPLSFPLYLKSVSKEPQNIRLCYLYFHKKRIKSLHDIGIHERIILMYGGLFLVSILIYIASKLSYKPIFEFLTNAALT